MTALQETLWGVRLVASQPWQFPPIRVGAAGKGPQKTSALSSFTHVTSTLGTVKDPTYNHTEGHRVTYWP
jgi:hypothetical protein